MPSTFPVDYCEPFDITYRRVTELITVLGNDLPDRPAREWLRTLVTGFQAERLRWPAVPAPNRGNPYNEYFHEAERLRRKFLRLTACAYLHISYDLPRVIADEWPGAGQWGTGPSETAGENIYLGLQGVFRIVMREMAGNPAVVGGGIWWRFFEFVTRDDDVVRGAASWMMQLRYAAWIHARRLRIPGIDRRSIERAMMQAMTTALQHVYDLKPWSAAILSPPDTAFLSVGLVAAATILPLGNLPWLALLFPLGLAYVLYRRRTILREYHDFNSLFAQRILEYMSVATATPDRLEAYLRRRDPRSRRPFFVEDSADGPGSGDLK